jgi:hypothetical protein
LTCLLVLLAFAPLAMMPDASSITSPYKATRSMNDAAVVAMGHGPLGSAGL